MRVYVYDWDAKLIKIWESSKKKFYPSGVDDGMKPLPPRATARG